MPTCSILVCKNDSKRNNLSKGGVSFHRFPKIPDIKEKWIQATGRQNWFPLKSSTICSNHFKDSDFVAKKSGNRYLMENAVPELNVLYFQLERKLPELTTSLTTPSIPSPEPTTSSPEPTVPSLNTTASDLNEFLILHDTPKKKLETEIAQLRWKAKQDRLKIRRLQMKVLRLKKKSNAAKESGTSSPDLNLGSGPSSPVLPTVPPRGSISPDPQPNTVYFQN